MADWFVDNFWMVILILIVMNSILDGIKFLKIEKRLKKLEPPPSEDDKTQKKLIHRLFK